GDAERGGERIDRIERLACGAVLAARPRRGTAQRTALPCRGPRAEVHARLQLDAAGPRLGHVLRLVDHQSVVVETSEAEGFDEILVTVVIAGKARVDRIALETQA